MLLVYNENIRLFLLHNLYSIKKDFSDFLESLSTFMESGNTKRMTCDPSWHQ